MPSDTFKDKDVIIHPTPVVDPVEVRVLQYAVDYWTRGKRIRSAYSMDGKFCAAGMVQHAHKHVTGKHVYYHSCSKKYLGMWCPEGINDFFPFGPTVLHQWMKFRLRRFKRLAAKGRLK